MPTSGKRSRFRVATWIAIVLALVASFLAATTTTAYADEPPAPTKRDRCGMDQDGLMVEDNDFFYWVGDEFIEPGVEWSTGGASSVEVIAAPREGSYYETPFILNYTDVPCPVEAPNRFWGEVGECDTGYKRTPVTIFVENVADETGRYIDRVRVRPVRLDGTITVDYEAVATDIADGETRSIVMDANQGGWLSGTWKLNFYINGVRVAQPRITIPYCDVTDPPPPSVVPPTAQLVPVYTRGAVAAKVRLNNSKTAKANTFKVQRIYKTKVTRTVQTKVAKYTTKVVWFYHIHKGTRIKVWYKTASGWKRILSALVRTPSNS